MWPQRDRWAVYLDAVREPDRLNDGCRNRCKVGLRPAILEQSVVSGAQSHQTAFEGVNGLAVTR